MNIEIVQGDITAISADAIVNAANSSLMGGGGVDAAIHRVGGDSILAECKKIRAEQGGCKTGQAVVTTAGLLPAQFVIHTVGPVWRGGDNQEAELLTQCYDRSLTLADDLQCRSIAFPSISTGAYHYPKIPAAQIAINAVKRKLSELKHIERIVFVCYDTETYQIYQDVMAQFDDY